MKCVRKFLTVTVVLMFSLMFYVQSHASNFNDTENAPDIDAINAVADLGIMVGYEGDFRPDDSITRAEIAKIITLITGGAASSNVPLPFTDIEEDHWAYGYIAYCLHDGIVAGVSDEEFQPNGNILYAEMLKMLIHAMGYDILAAGDYPDKYYTVAQNYLPALIEKHDESVRMQSLTRGEVAKLVYTALYLPMVQEEPKEKFLPNGNVSDNYYLFTNYYIANGENGTERITLYSKYFSNPEQ